MPRFTAGVAEHSSCEWAVVFAGVFDELYGDSGLAEGAVHLFGLARRVGCIAFALQQEEWRFGVGDSGEGALTPGVLLVFPGVAVPPAIVVGRVFGAVFAHLVDDRRAADYGAEAVGLALDEAGHLSAVAVADERHLVGVDGEFGEDGVDAGHDVLIVAASEIVFVGGGEGGSVPGAASGIGLEERPTVAEEELREGRA